MGKLRATIKNHRLFLISSFLVIICFLGIGSLQNKVLNRKTNLTAEDFRQQQNLTGVQLKLLQKMPSLGFDNLLADWTFLNFIQYYGDATARDATDYSLLPDYYELVVKKDPRFVKAYFLLAPATTLFGGRPDVSVDLMNYGLNYITPEIPLAYQVLMYKGIDELLFLGKTEEAKKSYEMASEWAKIENTEISLPIGQRATEMAEFLKGNPDSRLARASSWMMIFTNTREDVVREFALNEMKKLGAEVTFKGNVVSVSMPKD